VHTVGADRDLPAEPGARIDPERLQRQRHQPGGHLLAGRPDHIVFALVVHLAHVPGPPDQLVGRAGHRRHDDRDLVAGIDLAFDPARGVCDPLDVGNRCAANFWTIAPSSLVPGFSRNAPPARLQRIGSAPEVRDHVVSLLSAPEVSPY
jgi:hypothetical protein